jgi:co-chaperonin GroES (HSP10)
MRKANDFTPIKNKVFVTDMDSGEKLSRGGIIITDDDMQARGVRDRWARVWKVGPEVEDLAPGDWVLIKHGRWTHGLDIVQADGSEVRVWNIEYPEAVIVLADEDPRIVTTTTHTK